MYFTVMFSVNRLGQVIDIKNGLPNISFGDFDGIAVHVRARSRKSSCSHDADLKSPERKELIPFAIMQSSELFMPN